MKKTNILNRGGVVRRLLAAVLVCMLISTMLLGLSGCTGPGKGPQPSPTPVPPTAAPTPQPSPTPAPPTEEELKAANKALFDELDLDLFKSMVLGDTLTFMLSVDNPESFGIAAEDIPMTLGEFTEEAFNEWTAECAAYQGRLEQIDRSMLDERDQLSYDMIDRFIEYELIFADYYLFSEPLQPYVGLQSNLPVSLELMPLETAEDIEAYIAVLRDTGRYFDQIAAFEAEKLAEGLFMPKSAAETVVNDCKSFCKTGKKCFLITDFLERIADVELTDDERSAYIDQNSAAVLDVLLPAYEKLADEIKRLSDECEANGGSPLEKGLYYVDGGKEFFFESIRRASCAHMNANEIEDLLFDTLADRYEKLYSAYLGLPAGWENQSFELSVGSVQENLDYLRDKISEDFPALPEHDVRLYNVSKSLEDSFSPAAYLIPPVDNAFNNTIIINNKAVKDSQTLLATVGHEGYPGHMYQYIYQRNLEGVGLFQSVMSLTAYYEGWSQYAEEYVYKNTVIDRDMGELLATDSVIGNVLFPAIISLSVNGYGWDLADVESYLADFGMQAYAEYYYEYAVNMPTYYFDYAIGYSCFFRLYDLYKDEKGLEFDPYTFHEEYLSYGPAYFDMIEERLLGEE